MQALLQARSVRFVSLLSIATMMVASCARGVRPALRPSMDPAVQRLVPLPSSIEASGGTAFTVTPETAITVPEGDAHVMRVAGYLAHLVRLEGAASGKAVQTAAEPADGSIYLALGPRTASVGPEGYELTVSPTRITIVANQPAGLFYGVQTLRQLLPPVVEHAAARPETLTVPAVRIVDNPRFAWRGVMLDVARHFFTIDEVKRYIDLIVLHKMNRLHLHLADDQGWRIEIKSWPNLTEHGARTEVGGGPGGFYTQQQFADLVAYAQDRFVTIVPEIDMPGHTNAALASYPELNCDGVAPPLYSGIEVGFSTFCVDKDVTYRFIDDVVREIAALTPGDYFHVGGDEVKKLTDQQYRQFIERVQTIVQARGKLMIGWDEIAPATLLRTTVVQHWRPDWTPKAALAQNVKLIMSPATRTYLDMKYEKTTPIGLDWAALIEVRDSYAWDPASLLDGVAESTVLGVEAPLWSETLADIRDVELMAFPRLAAIAEVGWSPADGREWEDFRRRLGAQARRWSALGINFYRSSQVPWQH